MTKDEFLSAVRRSRGQWQEAERALANTANTAGDADRTHDDWVTVYGQRTAELCALLTEAYDSRDDVTEDELADAVAMSASDVRTFYDGSRSPQPSTS